MKKNVLIVFFWIVTLLGCFYLKSHAQSDKPKFRSFKGTGHIATVKTDLIADETTITYTKTGAKITCENDSVFSILHKAHGTLFRKWEWKWDRDYPGRHKVYIIYLSEGNADIIKQWAKNNL
jgi:hypothetical protein